ncbi:hypothetical protein TRVL_03817 [Trypanosoma vivax]|uniref:Uncharacterized protein n=1 Tax=Trypanosoma vivax (strain Y486) TaxID=1055687 RepID=G0U4Y9_TRYVY|nr:hypothetical protein TRVL_03817 [Trypanosoma vivax]CCC52504.1 conserved hypothetical protein [Trypanosoma vivax Y486]
MSGGTYFQRAINWMYGDTAYLQRVPPADIGEMHINELLGRHPFHPFDPVMKTDHPCSDCNALFYKCMVSEEFDGYELHMKHVSCYSPYKTDLMKCLAREKRLERMRMKNAT